MIRTFVAASIALLSATTVFAEMPNDLSEDDYKAMIADMQGMEPKLEKGELTAGQVDWLRKSCAALAVREAEREQKAVEDNVSYIASNVPCDKI